MIIDALNRLLKEFRVASVYVDGQPLVVGYPTKVSHELVVLSSLTPLGEGDGLVVIWIEDLVRVEDGSKYEEKCHKLFHVRTEKEPAYLREIPEVFDLITLFRLAQDMCLFVDVTLSDEPDSSLVGRVAELTKGWVKIERFTQYGEPDGQTLVKMQMVSRLYIDSREDRALALLQP